MSGALCSFLDRLYEYALFLRAKQTETVDSLWIACVLFVDIFVKPVERL